MKHYWEKGYIRLCLLLAVLCCTFFVNNKAIFVDIMESRNMVTAREMVYDDNWLTPTMNGELRLEKPPLPTWISAAVEYVSPDNLGLQRAMAGIAALLLVYYLFLLAEYISRSKLFAFLSVLILCTSYNIILMGRTASWDIYCHAFMMMAIYYLFRAFQSEVLQYKYFIIAGIALALSFLGKGPVSFYALLLPFIVAYCLFYRKPQKGKMKGFMWMLLLALVIGGWWYAYIYIYHPEMAEYVWNKESSSWSNRNVRPWYYYWKFFLETGAWSVVVIFSLFIPFWKKRLGEMSKVYLFSVSWMLLVVFFLSLIPEKKSRYLLPVSIPAALTVASLFYYWVSMLKEDDRIGKLLFRVNGVILSVIVTGLPGVLYYFLFRDGRISPDSFCFNSILLWMVAGYIIVSVKKLKAINYLYGIVALFVVAEVCLMPYIGIFVANPEKKSIALTRNVEVLKPLPFYYATDDTVRMELVYAAYKKIERINLSDSAKVMSALPFALVEYGETNRNSYPEWFKRNVTINPFDTYNDNSWPKGHRLYDSDFIKRVTVIRRK